MNYNLLGIQKNKYIISLKKLNIFLYENILFQRINKCTWLLKCFSIKTLCSNKNSFIRKIKKYHCGDEATWKKHTMSGGVGQHPWQERYLIVRVHLQIVWHSNKYMIEVDDKFSNEAYLDIWVWVTSISYPLFIILDIWWCKTYTLRLLM